MDAGELIAEHSQYVLNVLKKFKLSHEAAEDILQESSLKAFEKFRSCKDHQKFRAWFTTIAVNTFRNSLRGKGKLVGEEALLFLIDPKALADIRVHEKRIDEMIQEFVTTLPYRQRIAFEMRFIDGLPFKVIAAEMDCPYDTAKANYRHAVVKMKDHFKVLATFTKEFM